MPAGNAHRVLKTLYDAFTAGVGAGIGNDPGSAGTITPMMWGQVFPIVTEGVETRTLAQPNRAGVQVVVILDADGGNLTLTVTGGYNQGGDTTVVFDTAGDMAIFTSVKVGATYRWELTYQAGTSAMAGAGELVTQAAGNFALTAETHANRITLVNDADVVITLPAATATGDVYKVLIVTTAWTGGSIVAASASDSFLGGIQGVDNDADAPYAWKAETADDSIAGNGVATGGVVGDWYQFTDVATGLFLVEGFITQSGGSEATPCSAGV